MQLIKNTQFIQCAIDYSSDDYTINQLQFVIVFINIYIYIYFFIIGNRLIAKKADLFLMKFSYLYRILFPHLHDQRVPHQNLFFPTEISDIMYEQYKSGCNTTKTKYNITI